MNMRTKEEIIEGGPLLNIGGSSSIENEMLIDIRDCLVELIKLAKEVENK